VNALNKRFNQGWIQSKESDVDVVVQKIKQYKHEKKTISIGFHGNIVTLWERLVKEKEPLVDLGSDQTSLHNPFQGGYYPVTLSFEEARKMMVNDPARFKQEVYTSLRRHVAAVNALTSRGMHFWDYGNALCVHSN